MNFSDSALFFGSSEKLWPHLFGAAPCKVATKLCRNCRRVKVEGIRRYCARCARNRKRESDRRHVREKRRLDVGKTDITAVQAEGLTHTKIAFRYADT